MVLTTHAIVGASVANLMPSHPILGFTAGFASHFLLDAIPHWDYHLLSSKKDSQNPLNNDLILGKNFIIDLAKISTDALIGTMIAIFLFIDISNFNLNSFLTSAIFWGIVGSLLPDVLQFVYFKWRHEPLTTLQRFHNWIQKKRNLKNKPVLGIVSQLTIIIILATVSILVL